MLEVLAPFPRAPNLTLRVSPAHLIDGVLDEYVDAAHPDRGNCGSSVELGSSGCRGASVPECCPGRRHWCGVFRHLATHQWYLRRQSDGGGRARRTALD